MLTGAGIDLFQRRLPNPLCLAVLAVGAGYLAWSGSFAVLGSAALHSALALIVGMGLFKLGMIGGGDAKFYAATAIWFSLQSAFQLLLYVSVSGLALLAILILWRRISDRIRGTRSGLSRRGVPYGVAIAAGALALLASEM